MKKNETPSEPVHDSIRQALINQHAAECAAAFARGKRALLKDVERQREIEAALTDRLEIPPGSFTMQVESTSYGSAVWTVVVDDDHEDGFKLMAHRDDDRTYFTLVRYCIECADAWRNHTDYIGSLSVLVKQLERTDNTALLCPACRDEAHAEEMDDKLHYHVMRILEIMGAQHGN